MGLYKDLAVDFSDVVKASYHRIVSFSFDSVSFTTIVVVSSYISQADAEAGKNSVGTRNASLATVNPLELIAEGDVGTPVMVKIQSMLEAALVAESSDFAGATIG